VFAQPYQENSILSSGQKLISQEQKQSQQLINQEREAQAVIPESSIVEKEQQLISSQHLLGQEREEQATLMVPTFGR
jgi:hypothetical protein